MRASIRAFSSKNSQDSPDDPLDLFCRAEQPRVLGTRSALECSANCTDALLTRYAGDKFERSQHAYRTQRAQIHIPAYA